MIVYCGTSNKGKLREFQLAAPEFELRAVNAPPPEERGATFEETAIEKALYYCRQLASLCEDPNVAPLPLVAAHVPDCASADNEPRPGEAVPRRGSTLALTHDQSGWVFADDSGLEVDALGGAPGVHSARFAGPNATDAANNALLLNKLNDVQNRAARFVCAIALVRAGKLVQTFRGVVEGRILDEARGPHGFGYDPLFYYEPFGCTFGEADDSMKMSVSHRAQALSSMFSFLKLSTWKP